MRTPCSIQLACAVLLIVAALCNADADDDDANHDETFPYATRATTTEATTTDTDTTGPAPDTTGPAPDTTTLPGPTLSSESSEGKSENGRLEDGAKTSSESIKNKQGDKVAPFHAWAGEGKAEGGNGANRKPNGPEQRAIEDAVEYGLERMRSFYFVEEPELYKQGLFLEENHPAYILAAFRTPSEKALNYARYGYAALQARTRLAEIYPESIGRENQEPPAFKSELILEECPLQGLPRCPKGFERYRTADGTCNNFQHPWRGSSFLPMQRFLPPQYDNGIDTVRRSVSGRELPSPRLVSTTIHRDKNREVQSVTLMFMQWGQFLDHDLTSSAQARMFNKSVPRCCRRDGSGRLPPDLTHPECLPISVPENDWFLSQFGIGCIEFIRSAPTSRINCDLGWREQISQVTAYIDGSPIYGSDGDTADSIRTFKKGQLRYGRPKSQRTPPDPPEGELCRMGAITTDCFRRGDSRAGDQPGLTAFHTVWLRYHNRLALRLANLNHHWSDEKVYQESRRIVGALIQHITYREFLPLVLGKDVIKLFGLDLERKGYYKGYNPKINPAPANSFGTAAFRFGHSLVQRSFIRTDAAHRVIRNNVSLHEEEANAENIWSLGSIDRLLLGLSNQPIQRRDEFLTDELTNHLFQSPGFPFGLDLAAINIQRGRDHGIPSYTAWREPCGLIPLHNWTDLDRVMSATTVRRFKSIYDHIDDIDLFSGGLAEKPVKGGIVGPTFACILAQQFSQLRKGDRFWYENGGVESSFTPVQLQQIRRVNFARVLCQTTTEVETLQPFVFLSADDFANKRIPCDSMKGLDLSAWEEKPPLTNLFRRVDTNADDNYVDSTTELPDYYDDLTTEYEELESRARPTKKRKKPTKRRQNTKTKTKTKTKRPSAYINNHAVAHTPYKHKPKPTPTKKRPVKVTQSKPLTVYDKRPIAPNRKPTQQKPDVNGYLLDLAQPEPPYKVDINIFVTPQKQQATTRRTYIFKQTGKRPAFLANQYYDSNFVTKRPAYSGVYSNFNFDQMYHVYNPQIVYEDRPFSTSNQGSHHSFPNRVSTMRPVIIPSYLYLNDNEQDLEQYRLTPRPPPRRVTSYVYKINNKNGQHVLFDSNQHFMTVSYRPPGVYDQKVSTPMPPELDDDENDEYEEENYIKISSIHGQKYTSAEDMKRPMYISVQQREGELDIPDYPAVQHESPLLQIDVVPSEARQDEWKIYNATEETDATVSVFDVIHVNLNLTFSEELPRPMQFNDTNSV